MIDEVSIGIPVKIVRRHPDGHFRRHYYLQSVLSHPLVSDISLQSPGRNQFVIDQKKIFRLLT